MLAATVDSLSCCGCWFLFCPAGPAGALALALYPMLRTLGTGCLMDVQQEAGTGRRWGGAWVLVGEHSARMPVVSTLSSYRNFRSMLAVAWGVGKPDSCMVVCKR